MIQNVNEKIRLLFKSFYVWLYLALFTFSGGFAFCSTVIASGTSNLTGVSQYYFILLPFFLPLLVIAYRGKAFSNCKRDICSDYLSAISLFLISFLYLVVLQLIILITGVSKLGTFVNILVGLLFYGAMLIAIFFLIDKVIKNRILSIVIMYISATAVITGELLISLGVNSKLIYNLSISKYCQGFTNGVLDFKSLLCFLSVGLLSLLICSFIEKENIKKCLAGIMSIVLLAVMMFTVFTENGIFSGIDMTSGSFFTLSDTTTEYISTVDSEVKIYILDNRYNFIHNEEDTIYYVQAAKIMEEIAELSANISLEYIDIEKDTSFAENYPDENFNLGDVLVVYGDKYEHISYLDLFDVSYSYQGDDTSGYTYYYQITSSRTEEAICSAIYNVLDESKDIVTFLTGFDEDPSYVNFASILTQAGYDVRYCNIYEDEEPDDECKMFIIFAPTVDYTSKAESTVEALMYNDSEYNKNFIYVANRDTSLYLPNLDYLLSKWGLSVEYYTIMETDESLFPSNGNCMYTLQDYGSLVFADDYKYMEKNVVVPYSRYITYTEDGYQSFNILLQSSDTSAPIIFDDAGDVSLGDVKSYYTAVCSSYYQSDYYGNQVEGIEGHVVAISSNLAFSNDVLNSAEFSNKEYFLDIADNLSGRNDISVEITSRFITMKSINISGAVSVVLKILLLALIPATNLIFGVITSKKSSLKNKAY